MPPSRLALRAAAKAVVSVGRVVHLDAVILGTMQLPGAANDDELLVYSRGLLERVSAHGDVLAATGLPPDLLKRLGDEIAGFAAARDTQAASRQRFTAATAAIQGALDDADKAIDVLEAFVINTPDAPPELLTRLRIARRVGPRPVAKTPPPTPADKAA